ncbi:hypothetical protein SDC9_39137 [bioreactor metagenome]|uniref:Uncharacterized protein n=1 Tax=bioreactor metagenome TaxID=1076179 RepID=A0A644VRF5_9ZZZZ
MEFAGCGAERRKGRARRCDRVECQPLRGVRRGAAPRRRGWQRHHEAERRAGVAQHIDIGAGQPVAQQGCGTLGIALALCGELAQRLGRGQAALHRAALEGVARPDQPAEAVEQHHLVALSARPAVEQSPDQLPVSAQIGVAQRGLDLRRKRRGQRPRVTEPRSRCAGDVDRA